MPEAPRPPRPKLKLVENPGQSKAPEKAPISGGKKADSDTKNDAKTVADAAELEKRASRDLLRLVARGQGEAFIQKGEEAMYADPKNKKEVERGFDIKRFGIRTRLKELEEKRIRRGKGNVSDDIEIAKLKDEQKSMDEQRAVGKVKVGETEVRIKFETVELMDRFLTDLGVAGNKEIPLTVKNGETSEVKDFKYDSKDVQRLLENPKSGFHLELEVAVELVKQAIKDKNFRTEFGGKLAKQLGISEDSLGPFSEFCQKEHVKQIAKTSGKYAGMSGLLMLFVLYTDMKSVAGGGGQQMAA
ncbi:hypothetical protein A3G67_00285 [Candidatus Roizmanbacteria bacterium RIFCSPLOWO2_12_FULL_40_12]|uniref:Uncharacterized protein n=1 Tax=Candidatus Roizmanbacteria bacterium RIFCSPLOWO2_01_FULL_40_42 TaxID=1802066 RepID=A0A1F7J6J0_9BACT|nr:MAG: hypothetical protein A2779_02505 [Candidatus Roizmanbacteria bacterium RIFCSPHIGHO2_01_FULL_40_98]OGK29092.1 MAG: hypothetical protein A3C31_03290 [Candidatus Roizmanbacteria bacterium RIFCSPHIGHO2_02_FULL_40_53]OGK29320.1 MAG: hypothetical protein A2W49_05090 [Candidatus Roizmanbacteria bacterium RIFCSPHIGHO2_12_41_18]OGK36233.1 MAG: hypothetical protein A3E69_01330 [Candidatus Roizmanbacteria bacterium RIFCSPHIGHO2_12_FULL_40_130]OGK51216.1 MAG: hypothetical protein A3B50_03290 [Candi